MIPNCPYHSKDETLVEKTLRLEKEGSPRNELVKVFFQYVPKTRQINFSKTIRQLIAHGYPLEDAQMFYWDYNNKIFVYIGTFPFKQEHYLKYQNFQENIIHIRYRIISRIQNRERLENSAVASFHDKNPRDAHCNTPGAHRCAPAYHQSHRMEIETSAPQPCDCNARGLIRASGPAATQSLFIKAAEKRVKQRSIKEVLERVFQWRKLYEATNDVGKRLHTLESAAREVGIAKKTLDDYYLQLKQGQRHKFDFEKNENAKIGVLRAFVKDCQRTTRKQPYSLKLLQNMQLASGGPSASSAGGPEPPKMAEVASTIAQGSQTLSASGQQQEAIIREDPVSIYDEMDAMSCESPEEQSQYYLFHRQDSFEFSD